MSPERRQQLVEQLALVRINRDLRCRLKGGVMDVMIFILVGSGIGIAKQQGAVSPLVAIVLLLVTMAWLGYARLRGH